MDEKLKNDGVHSAAVRDHRRNYFTFLYVYPVISRRSRGLSIGINLNPDKICNFDCVYCEVDRINPPRVKHLDPAIVCAELEEMVRFFKNGGLNKDPRFASDNLSEIKDFAFSGDGEPTMIPNFSEFVQIAADVRKKENLVSTKIVLITNAAGLDKEDVRKGLKIMDENNGEIWGKLDAGTEQYYKLVNRSNIKFSRILDNLLLTARERPIIIQSLFLKIHSQMMSKEELEEYCHRLNELVANSAKIKEVHAYTVARPTPEPYATKLTPDELARIADAIRNKTGLTVYEFP
ncbi:MAG: radical SAM protein [Verrucomicrobiae bacterium]|nr:radical SAM protein [Verrucomicrobiae bacterium]